ncbi:threonine synthase [Papillibacter cinnamivorans]|uniref:Threonine synthase n=1 Tax=Papillibacter cinnamivorans DSM 12816 TaxID=1122930 RepID=A0A1W1YU85_9FIRM|nr:threonine synthase [Papillibacter cinnamivorans]SMC39719.1 threonine synthase [Papillibacter cinnamivorans DSM 12816]
MRYISTRDGVLRVSAQDAIVRGLAEDGGLYTPEVLPNFTAHAFESMRDMAYQQRAVFVMNAFLDDFAAGELSSFAEKAYGTDKFDSPAIAPLRRVTDGVSCLELWHGPTSAFKDMALQMLPHLLSASLVKTGEERSVLILVATSGDTGKAALEGFRDVDGTAILVFYPKDGVSRVQELQMVTQEGKNVGVCSVRGNFDDAQTGVKAIFSDVSLRKTLSKRGWFLSSANSINWGRVLPQIVYYVSAYCDLLNQGTLVPGEKFNVCVPTGNFGNILSAYYAKSMGVPIGRLVCASNRNDVLTDFINTGVYDRNRPFYNTLSPSMDILVSSNLERLLYGLSEGGAEEVREYMSSLAETGRYEVDETVKKKISRLFWAGSCDDALTRETIAAVWKEHGYLIDPHTAVAFHVFKQYRKETGDTAPGLVVSTASPFKFCDSVLPAIGVSPVSSGTDLIGELSAAAGIAPPKNLAALGSKPVRFTGVTEKDGMTREVLKMLER